MNNTKVPSKTDPSHQNCESANPPKELPKLLENRVGFLLAQTSRQIFLSTSEALMPTGLTPRHLGVLDFLVAQGCSTQTEVSDRVSIDRTTMVQVIDELEAQKLVTRERHPKDRRCHHLKITQQGLVAHKSALKIAEQSQKKFLEILSKQESELFLVFLRRLYLRKKEAN